MGIGDEVMVKECWGVTSVTEDAQPVNSQTLYDMASVSKIYATTMITLRFIERGILDLADMLPRYFGDLVPEDKQHITIFHLLTHTSGYPDHILLHAALTDPGETVPFLLKTPLKHPVGAVVEYSCMGFILLGKLLEKVFGQAVGSADARGSQRAAGAYFHGYHPLDKQTCTETRVHGARYVDGSWLVVR